MPVDSVKPGTAKPPADQISSRSANLDKTDFLQMLTAQLKAQDPMNPLNSQDFATQLAQFTSVQELQKISATLDSTLQAQGILAQTFSNAMSTSLIGKIVRADVNQFDISATGGGTVNYTLPSAATSISVNIKDSDGAIVRKIAVNAQAAGAQSVTWDGKDTNGRHVPAGTYTYAVNAKDSNNKAMSVTTYIEGRVSELQYKDGNPILMVNGVEISLGQVISIRDADPGTKKG